jgi:hypothetical protein
MTRIGSSTHDILWVSVDHCPPPQDGRAILLCNARGIGSHGVTCDTVRLVGLCAAYWVGSLEPGYWCLTGAQPVAPEVPFEPTHWAHIAVPGEVGNEV